MRRLTALLVLGLAGCTVPGPEDKVHDNIDAVVHEKQTAPQPVSPSGHPAQPPDVDVDPFIVMVKATRDGNVVHVRYAGALPSDGVYDFRVGGRAGDTLKLSIVDRNTSQERVSAVRPTSLGVDVPGVPATVTKVAVHGPSAGFAVISAAIE